MSEKQRLMRSLFETPGKELLNLKFFRFDTTGKVSEEAFCARINKLVFEIDAGITESTATFGRDPSHTVDLGELTQRLS